MFFITIPATTLAVLLVPERPIDETRESANDSSSQHSSGGNVDPGNGSKATDCVDGLDI